MGDNQLSRRAVRPIKALGKTFHKEKILITSETTHVVKHSLHIVLPDSVSDAKNDADKKIN